jgi:hypothetical protein
MRAARHTTFRLNGHRWACSRTPLPKPILNQNWVMSTSAVNRPERRFSALSDSVGLPCSSAVTVISGQIF